MNLKPTGLIRNCKTSPSGDVLTVEFDDATFTFHSQWLYDAKCDNGPSRNAMSAFSQNQPTAHIQEAFIGNATLDVFWHDETISRFPAPWLRVLAPLVAKPHELEQNQDLLLPKGWTPETLTIPEIPYMWLSEHLNPEQLEANIIRILDLILDESAAGIIKVTGLPNANIEEERNKSNTLVTQVLKKIFGTVFVHPRRGTDKSFNVTSHHIEDAKRGVGLPNYDTSQILLPHVDHAHYPYPVQVQGFYGLEGESENTFISAFAVLDTLRAEAPDLFEQMYTAPMVLGRVAAFYDPPLYDNTVDTAITTQPGFPQKIKRVRWHPHLTGSLVTPFDDFPKARLAYQKFQEIMRRDTHQLKLILKPGDMYVWNNFTMFHGRERVLTVPRTGVGQTVPELDVQAKYRALQLRRLNGHIDEKWLVHVPTPQLLDMVKLLGC